MNVNGSYNRSVSVCSYESIKPDATEKRQFIKIDAICEELKSFGSDTFDITPECVLETNYEGKVDNVVV